VNAINQKLNIGLRPIHADCFKVETKGTIMRVHARKGGNQGKGIKIGLPTELQ
jgi:hypothetical protein